MTGLFRSVAGLILWAVAFSVIYALQGLSCALGWDLMAAAGTSVARLVLLLSYIGFLAASAWLCWWYRPRPADRSFLDKMAFASAVIGLVSTIYTGMPVLSMSPCT